VRGRVNGQPPAAGKIAVLADTKTRKKKHGHGGGGGERAAGSGGDFLEQKGVLHQGGVVRIKVIVGYEEDKEQVRQRGEKTPMSRLTSDKQSQNPAGAAAVTEGRRKIETPKRGRSQVSVSENEDALMGQGEKTHGGGGRR